LIEFKGIIDNIKLNISIAYEIVSKYEKKGDWLFDQEYYRVMNVVITDFAKVTDWLDDEIAKESTEEQIKNGSRNQLIQCWIQVAKHLIEILEKTSSVSTTFEDSFGMGNGDCGVSCIVLNLKDVDYDQRPYFQDILYSAAQILLDNGEFDLASRYALMAAIESIWSRGRSDKEEVSIALDVIPSYLWKKREYIKYVDYIIKIFDWLYAFNNEWGEQFDAFIYLQYFHYDLLNYYNDLDEESKVKVIDYWKKSIKIIVTYYKGGLLFDNFLISDLVDEMVKDNKFDEAFQIIMIRIDALILNSKEILWVKQDKLEDFLKSIRNLMQTGFELKDKNTDRIKNVLNNMKSGGLENSVFKLANNLGYINSEENEWVYKDKKILEFIKDKNTKTIEIDTNQSKIEYKSGKERKIIFFAECKYKEKPATIRDIEFFYNKAKDFLDHQKDRAKLYPKKLLPRYGELWFVSIKGFTDDSKLIKRRIGKCTIKLVDGAELNEQLKMNNIRTIPII